MDGSSAVQLFLHNHLRFTILYHKDVATDLSRIVGFEVRLHLIPYESGTPHGKV